MFTANSMYSCLRFRASRFFAQTYHCFGLLSLQHNSMRTESQRCKRSCPVTKLSSLRFKN